MDVAEGVTVRYPFCAIMRHNAPPRAMRGSRGTRAAYRPVWRTGTGI